MPAGQSHYEVLQVDPRAAPEILEAAYRRLARMHHPDVSSAPGAEQRMKDINAAYDVLRDPQRRAAYDRERLAAAERPPARDGWRPAPRVPDDVWAPAEPSSGRIACRAHPEAVAIGICGTCGAGMCEWCFDRFQPPSCASCLLVWTSQRRRELAAPALWFILVLGITTVLLLRSLGVAARSGAVILALEAAFGYLIASYPSGWRVMRPIGDHDDGHAVVALLSAAVVGPVVAPFRMGKIAWDLRQLGHLESLARDEE